MSKRLNGYMTHALKEVFIDMSLRTHGMVCCVIAYCERSTVRIDLELIPACEDVLYLINTGTTLDPWTNEKPSIHINIDSAKVLI